MIGCRFEERDAVTIQIRDGQAEVIKIRSTEGDKSTASEKKGENCLYL